MIETTTDYERHLRQQIARIDWQASRGLVGRGWDWLMVKLVGYLWSYHGHVEDPRASKRELEAAIRAHRQHLRGQGYFDQEFTS